MKKWLLFLTLFSLPHLAFDQDKKIDQLEVLYSQKYYSKVIKKANKLLAIPDYDYSGMPSFYKSLALFRLVDDENWIKKQDENLDDAIEIYNHFLSFAKVQSYTKSHYFEIAELKQYLIVLEKKYRGYHSARANKIKLFTENQLKSITPYGLGQDLVVKIEKKERSKDSEKIIVPSFSGNSEVKIREEVIDYAMKYLGTPYSWAGASPNGFDCSGYTGYIFKNFGVTLPRSAAAQKEYVSTISEKNAAKGDLVFFKSGNKITHVGIVISEQGQPLKMVHSSSSKGIIVTDIDSSNYWRKKCAGVGRIIQ